MGHMKKYKCPTCLKTSSVVRQRKRKTSIVFYCKLCKKYFSINTYFLDRKSILNDHLDGLSFRDLARKYSISKSYAWEICQDELKKLPDNNQFTHKFCNRFSKIFLFDGKYFNVVTEEESNPDWVLLWGIDYLRHDIPVFTVAPAENYHTWRRFFSFYRILDLHPKLLVCDDHQGLKLAAISAFPSSRIQSCYNHYKENIRLNLNVRSDDTYKPFMRKVEKILDSKNKLADDTFNAWMFKLYKEFGSDPVTLNVLTNIEKSKTELLAYRNIPQAPLTTNLIEGMNNHIEIRLKPLNSFQSVEYAKLWFNGYILKRRFTPYTDTKGKFRFLRGKTGVEMTKKQGVDLPIYF